MLDWLTARIGYGASRLRLAHHIELSPDGEVRRHVERAESVQGSFSSTVLVGKSVATDYMRLRGYEGPSEVLWISGNPTKFLQGHNVFGPDAWRLRPVVQAFVRQLPPEYRPDGVDSAVLPVVDSSRQDVTVHVDLDTHGIVHEWLELAARQTRSRHARRVQDVGTTVYWGQGSRRWTLKAYCKFCEIEKRPPEVAPVWAPRLKDFSESLVRVELTLRRPELEKRELLDEGVVWEYFRKIEVGVMDEEIRGVVDWSNPALAGLPSGAKLVLGNWVHGEDVRWSVPNRTFYHYRRLLLDALGVDISIPWQGDQVKSLTRANFDVQYLRDHEIKYLPQGFQPILLKVGTGAEAWPEGFKPDVAPHRRGFIPNG